MERNKANLGVWEKIRILYLSFPKSLKDQIHPDGTETVENFLTEVKKQDKTSKSIFIALLITTRILI